MCQSWEFSCGHIRETHCQSYKNGTLVQTSINSANDIDFDEDPFTDDVDRTSTVKARANRAQSSPTPKSSCLTTYMLPSSPPGPFMARESTAPSSIHGVHRRESMNSDMAHRKFVPGLALGSSDSLAASHPHLPPGLIENISRCSGPDDESNKISDPCYACILRESKSNTAFRKNEHDAETRLYHEVSGRHSRAADKNQYHEAHDDDSSLLRYGSGPSANVISALDHPYGSQAPRASRGNHRGGSMAPMSTARPGSAPRQHQHWHHPPHPNTQHGNTKFSSHPPPQSAFMINQASHQATTGGPPSFFAPPHGGDTSSPFLPPARFDNQRPLSRSAAPQPGFPFQPTPYQAPSQPYATQMPHTYNAHQFRPPDASGRGNERVGFPAPGQMTQMSHSYGYFPGQ